MTKSTELATRGPSEVGTADEIQGHDPLSLIRHAVASGQMDVEVLERLMDLEERVMERHAERAMAEALAAFQAECPPIPKSKTAKVMKNGTLQYTYDYAPLETVVPIIRPVLGKHGLSFTHDTRVEGNAISVTCTLRHVDGATRTATFTGPIDTSGGKNPIQQVASGQAYGKRYSLFDVLGLVAGGEDDDGHGTTGAPTQALTKEQVADLTALAEDVGADLGRFCTYLGVDSLAKLPASRMEEAKKALEDKRRKG